MKKKTRDLLVRIFLVLIFLLRLIFLIACIGVILEAENKGINDESVTIKMLIIALKGNTHQLGLNTKFSPNVPTLKVTAQTETKMLTGVLIRHKINVSLP